MGLLMGRLVEESEVERSSVASCERWSSEVAHCQPFPLQ